MQACIEHSSLTTLVAVAKASLGLGRRRSAIAAEQCGTINSNRYYNFIDAQKSLNSSHLKTKGFFKNPFIIFS